MDTAWVDFAVLTQGAFPPLVTYALSGFVTVAIGVATSRGTLGF